MVYWGVVREFGRQVGVLACRLAAGSVETWTARVCSAGSLRVSPFSGSWHGGHVGGDAAWCLVTPPCTRTTILSCTLRIREGCLGICMRREGDLGG